MRLRTSGRAWSSVLGDEWFAFVGFWSPPRPDAPPAADREGVPWATWHEYLAAWLDVREDYFATCDPADALPYAERILEEHGPDGPPA